MKTTVPSLALALLLGAALASPSSAQTRRALVVGIDRYAPVPVEGLEAGEGVKPFADLDGSVNDARAMSAVLEARYGFARENIVRLTDEQATRAGILSAFRAHLIEGSQPGDIALFFYAGHGSLIRDSRNAAGENPYNQTLVPHDFNRGALPILDKELRFLLNDLLDTGAHVSAFFDSCHSGSITRGVPEGGKYRWIPPDDRDAAELYEAEPDTRPSPESRGAIVMSAAQDNQRAKETIDASGLHHGLFSNALLRVLRTEPVDQSALNVYHRVRALVETETSRQVPQLGGLQSGSREDDRYAATRLIGPTPEGASGGIAVAVRAIEGDEIKLPGGLALGLSKGTELQASKEGSEVRLRVVRALDLDTSLAKIIEGEPANVEVGDLFEVATWVTQAASLLRVWIGAELERDELAALAPVFAELREADELEWFSDPTLIESSDRLVRLNFMGDSWELHGQDGRIASLARSFRAEDALQALSAHLPARLFVTIPPASDIAQALRREAQQGSAVRLVDSRSEAHYALFGTIAGETISYSWARPGGFGGADASELGMPTRTDWVSLSSERRETAGYRLGDQAKKIARAREWLQLESPPEKHPFPYRLVIRDTQSHTIIEGRDLLEGEEIELVLHADKLPRRQRARFVYLLALDSSGASQLLYGRSIDDNSFPRVGQEKQQSFVLRSPLNITEPFGIDTLILLTTTTKLSNTSALSWEGVTSNAPLPGPTRGSQSSNPLERLLTRFGNATRGEGIATPADWSIQRLRFVTRAAN